VTELVADGKTDRAIAGELGIAVDTVRTYLKRVFAKLGVRNRTEIAFRFWSSGEVGRRRTR
jgi:DNA-binding CsgD family transcriptional regulator